MRSIQQFSFSISSQTAAFHFSLYVNPDIYLENDITGCEDAIMFLWHWTNEDLLGSIMFSGHNKMEKHHKNKMTLQQLSAMMFYYWMIPS